MTTLPSDSGVPPRIITHLNALLEAVSACSTKEIMQAISLVREMAKLSSWNPLPTVQLAEGPVDVIAALATRVLLLAREIAALSVQESEQIIFLGKNQADILRVITAKLITLVRSTPYQLGDIAAKMLALIEDLAELPAGLASKAIIIGGEIAFTGSDALAAFDWLARKNAAIFGVELWLQEGSMPIWLATSDYQTKQCQDISDWEEYVWCCSSGASKFVNQFLSIEGALFNYSWGKERMD